VWYSYKVKASKKGRPLAKWEEEVSRRASEILGYEVYYSLPNSVRMMHLDDAVEWIVEDQQRSREERYSMSEVIAIIEDQEGNCPICQYPLDGESKLTVDRNVDGEAVGVLCDTCAELRAFVGAYTFVADGLAAYLWDVQGEGETEILCDCCKMERELEEG
jgi:hypothetical protein